MTTNQNIRENGVSVVICCYNSSKRLVATLDRILNQQTKTGINWEIIVINNNSTDDTFLVANDILASARQQIPFQIVNEPNPGLSNARKKGYETATYEYLILVDDDNWLVSSYVQNVYELFESQTQVGIIGGWGEPEFENPEPNWFGPFSSCYALGEQGEIREGETWTETEMVYGAGLAIRMTAYDVLNEAGYVSILSDRMGGALISGGDTELCMAMNLSQYKIVYDNRLKFKHLMPAGRINWNYLKKLTYGFGRATVKTQIYDHYILGHSMPNLSLRFPLWFDRYLNILRSFPLYWKQILFGLINQKPGDSKYLEYLGWKGRLAELRSLGNQYEKDHAQVARLAKELKDKESKEV